MLDNISPPILSAKLISCIDFEKVISVVLYYIPRQPNHIIC